MTKYTTKTSDIKLDFFIKKSFHYHALCRGNTTAAYILQLIADSPQQWVLLTSAYIQSRLYYSVKDRTIRKAIQALIDLSLIEAGGCKSEPAFKLNQPVIDLYLDCLERVLPDHRDGFGGYHMPKLIDSLSAEFAEWNGVLSAGNAECLSAEFADNIDKYLVYNTNTLLTSKCSVSPKGQEQTTTSTVEDLSTTYHQGKEIRNEEQQPESTTTPMSMESVKTIIKAYNSGGSKFKSKQYKKSVNNLISRYGAQVEKILNEHGEENTTTGIKAFLQDEYWQAQGLPLHAFIKTPWKWIPSDGSETSPAQSKTGGSRLPRPMPYQSNLGLSAPQESASESGSVLPVAAPPDNSRLRVMRRNEGLVLLQSCGSPRYGEFRDNSSPEALALLSDSEVDLWFGQCVAEFEALTRRKAPVTSRPVAKVEVAA